MSIAVLKDIQLGGKGVILPGAAMHKLVLGDDLMVSVLCFDCLSYLVCFQESLSCDCIEDMRMSCVAQTSFATNS